MTSAMRPLVSAQEATSRLELVFPRAAFDPVLSNPLAGAAVAAMLYVNAVVDAGGELEQDAVWARPSTCTRMSDAALAHGSTDERRAWRDAAARSKDALEALQASWGEDFAPRYADNTRETLRDETFRQWLEHGALRRRPNVATTSSAPRWALFASFAALFDPDLTGEDLVGAVQAWREAHMSPGAKMRALVASSRERQLYQVEVQLPDGTVRALEPGVASLILKGVLEQWAPHRLVDPFVIAISEPGEKVFTGDAAVLRRLGLRIDATEVLPDALLADVGVDPVVFWVVEAVATDGPITEARRRDLLAWAQRQSIPADSCSFLTAFVSRSDSAARKRLKDLAVGTYAWFADEPEHELAWYEIASR